MTSESVHVNAAISFLIFARPYGGYCHHAHRVARASSNLPSPTPPAEAMNGPSSLYLALCSSARVHIIHPTSTPARRQVAQGRRSELRAADSLGFADPEHLCPALGTNTLCRWFVVLQCDLLRILDLHLCLALYAVCLCHATSFWFTLSLTHGWLFFNRFKGRLQP